jgi:L-methionine (R)-S-oxide reductase
MSSEELKFTPTLPREAIYAELLPQIKSIIENETDLIANLANVAAILKEAFGFLWIGFYLVKDKELVLGPFQGPLACTRIAFGKGVCGAAWKEKKTIIVPDVEKFPGHIACSSKSRSEIVVPLFDAAKNIWAILDLDSEKLSDFSEIDEKNLFEILKLLTPCVSKNK